METKKVLFAFIASFALVLMFSFVLAAKSEENSTDMNATVKEAKNITYGQCVSQNAVVKNDCYRSVKDTYFSCKNSTSDRKTCSKDYKTDLAQCKKEFKLAKNECKKIKHNFFETARYALA
jgi:hypothetical protein